MSGQGTAHNPTTGSQSASLVDVKMSKGASFRVPGGHSKRPLIMPTDLDAAVSARKREARAQFQTEITIVLVLAIISLGLGLLFKVLWQYS